MKKVFYILISLLIFFGVFVFAQEAVIFPVEELGGCRNFKECANFCDRPENFKVCNDFAEAHDMIPQEQANQTRQVLELADMGGPGGCQGQEECETYCSIPDHMEECIVFAIENNLIPPEEIEEAKKALEAIRKGARPPPCKGKKECDIYCSEPEHLEECLAFGEAAGFISPEEVEMVRKTGGKGPGNCRGKEECDAYCQEPDNMEECINFGLEYGVIPPEEIENVKKTLEALKKGVKPPNCRGKEECDKYCSQPEHAEECVDFAVAAGFILPEEAEQAKKMAKLGIMSGPGGCKGKEECEAYCNNPDNMVECVEFGEKAGLMTPEQAQQARKMAELGITGGPGGCKSQQDCEAFCQAPENMEECLEFGQKMGLVSPEEVKMAKELGPEGPGGPGGCRGEEECKTYCSQPEHSEECINFSVERGFMSPEEAERTREMMKMPPPEGMTPPPEGFQPSPEEFKPPEGMMPPEGIMPSPKEFMPPPEGIQPLPEGVIQPPSGEMKPPTEQMLPQGEILPPQEIFLPPQESVPPPTQEAPQTLLDIFRFLASVATPFLRLR